MPRPKGSKNKAKTSSIPTTDFTSLIAEKAAAKDALVSDSDFDDLMSILRKS